MPTALKLVLVILALGLLAGGSCGAMTDPFADRHAKILCNETTVGSPIADFRARATNALRHGIFSSRTNTLIELEAYPDRPASSDAVFTIFVFARVICSAQYENDRVVGTRISSLD